jgi:hypothetical protein
MTKLDHKVTVQMSKEMYDALEKLQVKNEYDQKVAKATIVRYAIHKFLDSK